MPYKLSETPEALTDRWGRETFEHLTSLVHSAEAAAAGVQMTYAQCLFLSEEPDPFWAGCVHGFRRMGPRELELFSRPVDWPAVQAAAAAAAAAAASGGGSGAGGGGVGDGSIDSFAVGEAAGAFADGYSFNTVVCEGRLYMRWLSAQLERAGAVQVQRRLHSLADLAGEGWDLAVNCCGLGSRALLPDPLTYPIRGQIMRVRAPWVSQCVFAHFADETCYLIPNRDWLVLGGTGQVGDSSTAVSLADADRIAERAMMVVPSLAHAELIDHWVGLRPGRVRLRLEGEVVPAAALQAAADAAGGEGGGEGGRKRGPVEDLRVVHCYGHGGSGLTLAWGTAGDAAQLAVQMLGGGGGGGGSGTAAG